MSGRCSHECFLTSHSPSPLSLSPLSPPPKLSFSLHYCTPYIHLCAFILPYPSLHHYPSLQTYTPLIPTLGTPTPSFSTPYPYFHLPLTLPFFSQYPLSNVCTLIPFLNAPSPHLYPIPLQHTCTPSFSHYPPLLTLPLSLSQP